MVYIRPVIVEGGSTILRFPVNPSYQRALCKNFPVSSRKTGAAGGECSLPEGAAAEASEFTERGLF